ncbi:hypothetical protein [Xylanibacter muris]|uniref:EpsG family protein n=1 Tax=Xylanibacter muris TaxID=2736290 RepID=A0ABX2ARE8_9BACT|nr:hypothetical protein [Xylanibacter muris]NPD92800.1 hypothetical protein [Xylanibacter muris]
MILFFITLCFLVFILYNAQSRDRENRVFFVALFFAGLAFFQSVDINSDLQVAFSHLNQIRKFGWKYFDNDIESSFYFTGRDALKLYFYLLSFFSYNNFYSAISIFFIYYLPMKNVLLLSKRYSLQNLQINYLLILIIITIDFYDCANGVRNALAFAVFAHAIVLDLYYKKHIYIILWCIFLYLISAFLHSSAWILIVLRILLLLCIRKKTLLVMGCFVIFWSFYVLTFSPFLTDSDNSVFQSLNHHVEAYTDSTSESLNFDSESFNNRKSYILMRSFRILHVIVVLYFFTKMLKSYKTTMLQNYVFLLGCFCIGATSVNLATNILSRFSFEMIFLVPLFCLESLVSPIGNKYRILFNIKMNSLLLSLTIVALLFNYYMFRYHYYYMLFNFCLYK